MPVGIPVVAEEINLPKIISSAENLVVEECPGCPFREDIEHGDVLLIPVFGEDNPPAEIPVKIAREGVEVS